MKRKSCDWWIFYGYFMIFMLLKQRIISRSRDVFLIFWSEFSVWLGTKSFFFGIKIQLYSSSLCQEFSHFNCVIFRLFKFEIPINRTKILQLKYKNVKDLLRSILNMPFLKKVFFYNCIHLKKYSYYYEYCIIIAVCFWNFVSVLKKLFFVTI